MNGIDAAVFVLGVAIIAAALAYMVWERWDERRRRERRVHVNLRRMGWKT